MSSPNTWRRDRRSKGNQSLRAVCAHRFAGIDTDLETLLAANRFAADVRSAFAGISEPERTIRRFLLEADIETLDGLMALASDGRFAELRQAVSAAPDLDADLIEHSALLKRTANEVDAIRLGFVAAGFRTDITPAQAGELSRIVAHLAEIDAELTSGRGAEFLGPAWAGPATDSASICAACG